LALRPSEKRDAAGVVGTRGAEGQKVSEIWQGASCILLCTL
jgi:hypothetical protein